MVVDIIVFKLVISFKQNPVQKVAKIEQHLPSFNCYITLVHFIALIAYLNSWNILLLRIISRVFVQPPSMQSAQCKKALQFDAPTKYLADPRLCAFQM